jgi:hypothetical protein
MPAVKDLFIALGLKMDDAAFAAADVAITGLKKGLLATGVAFGGVIAGFAAMLKQTADAGTQTARTARQVGLTTQQLQGLRFAASDAGVGADELDGAMKALSRSSYEASIHGGAAGVAFYRLGIQAFTSYGKARPLQQLLPEIADRFAKLPDSVEKTAWATSIFGDAGAALIPLLNKGRGALEELSKEAVRFGVVMDAKSIAAAEGMSRSIRHVNSALEGLRNAIAVPWLRIVSPLLEAFANWIATNRELIATKITEWIGFVMRAAAGLYGVLQRAATWFGAIWDRAGALKPVLLALGGVVLGLVAPWAALAAAIALVAEDLYVYSKGGKSLFGFLKDQLGELVDDLKDAWDDFTEDPFGTLYEYAKKFFDWFVDAAAKLPAKIAAALSSPEPGAGLGAMASGGRPAWWLKATDWLGKLGRHDDGQFFHWPGAGDKPYTPEEQARIREALARDYSVSDGYSARPGAMLPPGYGVLAGAPPAAAAPAQILVQTNITAGPGTDGRQVGQDFLAVVEPKIREIVQQVNATDRSAAARALNR